MPDDLTPPVQVAPVTDPPVTQVVAPVVPPVAEPVVVPVPVVVAPPDYSAGELDAALRILEAQAAASMTTEFRAAEMVVKSLPETEENKAQLNLARQQLELQRQQLQHQLGTVIPQAMQQYKAFLLKQHEDHGIPISLLATATTEQQLNAIITEWGKAHPKQVNKEVVPGGSTTAGGQASGSPAPSPQTAAPVAAQAPPAKPMDSGVTSGGPTDEPWRNLSAREKVLFGMGLGAKASA